MIDANELRIGNWGMQDGEPYLFDLGEKIDDFSDITQPIPLTPEILEKAGFIDCNSPDDRYRIFGNSGDDSDFFLEYDWYQRTSGYLPMIKIEEYETIGNHIIYLHQLQNLYFALTGEELNIQL